MSHEPISIIFFTFIIVTLFSVFTTIIPVGLWISALSAGVKVSMFTLIGMRLRTVPPAKIIKPLIKIRKAGLMMTSDLLESHYLAGGHVDSVVDALIAAHRANIELSFEKAAAIDLAGRDVFEAVRMSVTPKVIETPWISAVAKNGIEIKVIARITVKTNIQQLVGGAGEETIIARVGEGIVTTVGSATDHKSVLENPDSISKVVLEKGLDSGTAYEILSIDIADIDIGSNVGASLQIDQAEADKQIAQAKAEERRALAIAQEQEMRAKVVEAESDVPKALAEALRNGNIGVMDYYNLEHTKANIELKKNLSELDFSVNVSGDRKSKEDISAVEEESNKQKQ